MNSRIVILSKHSIFVEGIATRLRQMPNQVDVGFVDPDQADYRQQIATLKPTAILMDVMDSKTLQYCLLCELLVTFPDITIVRLTIDQTDVQVVTSQMRYLPEVQDLFDVLTSPQNTVN